MFPALDIDAICRITAKIMHVFEHLVLISASFTKSCGQHVSSPECLCRAALHRKPAGRTLFVCSDGDRTFCLFLHHRSCMWISLVILTMRLRVILLLYLQGNSTKLPLFLAACSLEADVELALSLSVDLSSVVGRQMWTIRMRVFGKVLIKSCILSKDGCRSARFLPDLWLRLL